MKTRAIILMSILLISLTASAEEPVTLFTAARVFDGEQMHRDWVVAIAGEKIVYAGKAKGMPEFKASTAIDLPDQTLMPGLIEGHSHILLHPYNEAAWNDQVLKESEAERVARAVNHAHASLMAGVTTMRDLGSEGAGYADVGVYPHGDNVRELEMMVDYGMKPIDALRAATAVNARIFHLADSVGLIKAGLTADIIAVEGDPGKDISTLRRPRMVMKSGTRYRLN